MDLVVRAEITEKTKLERSIKTRLYWPSSNGRQDLWRLGHAPKFPNASNLMFLLRYYDISAINRFRDFVIFTADKMAEGGIHDHLGGGFARYATDQKWLAHILKKCYTTMRCCRKCEYQIMAEPYMHIICKTLDYVIREMTHPDGGYSAQDADSEEKKANSIFGKRTRSNL